MPTLPTLMSRQCPADWRSVARDYVREDTNVQVLIDAIEYAKLLRLYRIVL